MKVMKFMVLFSFLCFIGCGGPKTGSPGDQNDPAISGSDEEQANEPEGAVDTRSDEP